MLIGSCARAKASWSDWPWDLGSDEQGEDVAVGGEREDGLGRRDAAARKK